MVLGKTTTINMITGITDITNGNITINNFDIEKEPVKAKENIGLVPDSPDLFANFDVSKYFDFMIEMYNVDKKLRKRKSRKTCKRV